MCKFTHDLVLCVCIISLVQICIKGYETFPLVISYIKLRHFILYTFSGLHNIRLDKLFEQVMLYLEIIYSIK